VRVEYENERESEQETREEDRTPFLRGRHGALHSQGPLGGVPYDSAGGRIRASQRWICPRVDDGDGHSARIDI
jgi:hypothetical protein